MLPHTQTPVEKGYQNKRSISGGRMIFWFNEEEVVGGSCVRLRYGVTQLVIITRVQEGGF